ncbi:MAG: transketolase [Desulfarculus sp.]|nr:transketolase [Desulfarculus sp.]
MSEPNKNLDQLCVNSIRMLAVDMVEAAKSGHPGMPLGAASMAYVLWHRHLRHNPQNPQWPDRDRFVLSAGHGSALLYSLLHLSGYDLPLTELKNFRQWGSQTPGHPEYGHVPGVEATTGPLGQGFGMGVGMALAERFLAGQFNRPGHELINHFTYAIVSDGDLMEGVAAEAASLAGTLGLDKLIYLYDDNKITIEGSTDLAFTEDVGMRFAAYGWQVLTVADGDDLMAIDQAIVQAKADTQRPSLVMLRTHIGCGSPKQDSASAHGEPLGPQATQATRECFAWPEEPFHVPGEASACLRQALRRGRQLEDQWQQRLAAYAQAFPELAQAYALQLKGKLPEGWRQSLPVFSAQDKPLATRVASGKVLNALALAIPNMIGGSADLAPSNKTLIAGSGDVRGRGAECGRNIHFGVREHAMGAVVNGLALHGGVIPYGATFFVFADFVRPSLRLAALMGLPSLFIFTHDSLAVGEDGPTHQPVEQLMSLRVMPGFTVFRPAEANETAQCWALALERKGPSALVLTRQDLPILDMERYPVAQGVARGAYVLSDSGVQPQIILLATGSEVSLAMQAQEALQAQGVASRVVSMPSWEVFAEQDKAYRESVLPPAIRVRLAIEAGATLGWERWVGDSGAVIGVDRFGASAPGGRVMKEYGFNVDHVVARALELLKA